MKKIMLIITLGLMMLSSIGCSSKGSIKGTILEDAPTWVKQPYIKGYITGLGIASANKGDDLAFQRSEAMALARDDMARQIETKVGSFFDKFAESIGTGDKEVFLKDAKSKIHTIAKQKIRGARTRDTWIDKKERLYILMTLETNEVLKMLKQSSSAFKDKEIEFQRYLSGMNLNMLNKDLENYNK